LTDILEQLETHNFFLNNELGVSKNQISYFPLGGIPINNRIYQLYRNQIRKKYNLKNKIVLLIAGKLQSKININDFLTFLKKINYSYIVLFICGSYPNIEKYIKDSKLNIKIFHFGFIGSVELQKKMAASDIYIQFGQSVLAQLSMFYSNAVLLNNTKEYKYLAKNCGYAFNNINDLEKKFKKILKRKNLNILKKNSKNKAEKNLNYIKNYSKILNL
jgi:23S rRNA pseudoU1915 N3-methylase RlmH